MTKKYGILQTSSTSCIFYKEDEDGNQSTFNIFITPEGELEEKKKLHAFIDNEQMNEENWFSKDTMDVKDIVQAFGGWASEAPLLFELNAHKSMEKCLKSVLSNE
jgi:hypothetical protein